MDLESGGSTEGAIATRKNSPSSIFDSLYKMLPVVLPLIQQYFGAGTVVKHEDKTSGGALAKNGQYAEVAT